jgi:hypothetical protein
MKLLYFLLIAVISLPAFTVNAYAQKPVTAQDICHVSSDNFNFTKYFDWLQEQVVDTALLAYEENLEKAKAGRKPKGINAPKSSYPVEKKATVAVASPAIESGLVKNSFATGPTQSAVELLVEESSDEIAHLAYASAKRTNYDSPDLFWSYFQIADTFTGEATILRTNQGTMIEATHVIRPPQSMKYANDASSKYFYPLARVSVSGLMPYMEDFGAILPLLGTPNLGFDKVAVQGELGVGIKLYTQNLDTIETELSMGTETRFANGSDNADIPTAHIKLKISTD